MTLGLQQLITQKINWNERMAQVYRNSQTLSEVDEQQFENFHINFYRKLVQYPYFRYMCMLEGGNTKENSDNVLGTIHVFTSQLKYDQYIQRFESKLMKKEYSSVKVSSAPNIAFILASLSSSTATFDMISMVIDDTVTLSPNELSYVMSWSSTVWTELSIGTLVKSIEEESALKKEVQDLKNHLEMAKKTQKSPFVVNTKFKKHLEDKENTMTKQSEKVKTLKSKLYLTEKWHVVNCETNSEADIEKYIHKTNSGRRVVFAYSSPDVTSRDVLYLMPKAALKDVTLSTVSGQELFNFLSKNMHEVDSLRMCFLTSNNQIASHEFSGEDILSITELGKETASKTLPAEPSQN